MFYQQFKFYGFIYIIAALQWLIFTPHRPTWKKILNIISVYNSVKCAVMVATILFDNWWQPQYYPINHIFYIGPNIDENLSSVAAYLAIDAIFQFAIWNDPEPIDYLLVMNNLIWSLTLWVTVQTKINFYIACCFMASQSVNLLPKKYSFIVLAGLLPLWSYLIKNNVYLIYLNWEYQFLLYTVSLVHSLTVSLQITYWSTNYSV